MNVDPYILGIILPIIAFVLTIIVVISDSGIVDLIAQIFLIIILLADLALISPCSVVL